MQISADVLEVDDFGQLTGEGGVDLAAVFTQNGFHAGHAQGFVDVVFGFACDGFGFGREAGLFFGAVVFVEFVQTPFVEGHFLSLSKSADFGVVFF